ncbi:MAG: 16S rRNA processing protein RimM [Acidobacteria bacterium]|nr:MAG: 16S rRNA processing protein RimM [Acidobacteriota bacterium]
MSDTASQRQVRRGARATEAGGDMHGFIAIARVVRPQGRKGEVLAEILTDFPARFRDLRQAFLDKPGKHPQAVTIEHTWLHKGKVVLKLAGIGSIDDAEALRERLVLVPADERVALSANQYYVWELKGCQVVVETGGMRTPLGTVIEVERTAGADMLYVADGSREVMVPFAEEICKLIDLESRLIVIEPPEDLLDLNRD